MKTMMTGYRPKAQVAGVISAKRRSRTPSGKSDGRWTVPYLPIDPKDVGREYESDVIRINSQSGKGGVAFILKQNYGLVLPERMREEVGYLIKGVSDERHAELSPVDIFEIFEKNYIKIRTHFDVTGSNFTPEGEELMFTRLTINHDGVEKRISGPPGTTGSFCGWFPSLSGMRATISL